LYILAEERATACHLHTHAKKLVRGLFPSCHVALATPADSLQSSGTCGYLQKPVLEFTRVQLCWQRGLNGFCASTEKK